MSERVKKALNTIREAIQEARRPLSQAEDRELMEEMMADAEGWDMALKEADREVEDHDEDEE
jgi:hypothetical protein